MRSADIIAHSHKLAFNLLSYATIFCFAAKQSMWIFILIMVLPFLSALLHHVLHKMSLSVTP